jgi:hypothetical protein
MDVSARAAAAGVMLVSAHTAAAATRHDENLDGRRIRFILECESTALKERMHLIRFAISIDKGNNAAVRHRPRCRLFLFRFFFAAVIAPRQRENKRGEDEDRETGGFSGLPINGNMGGGGGGSHQ